MGRGSVTTTMFAATTVKNAAMIAAIVAPLLTLVNQWEAFFADAPFDWPEFILTCAMPYLVSTITAMLIRPPAESSRAEDPPAETPIVDDPPVLAEDPVDLPVVMPVAPALALADFSVILGSVEERGRMIRANAETVNATSKERAVIIGELIGRAETLSIRCCLHIG